MRRFLPLLAALAALEPPAAPAAEARPNIVFILVDDLRWDALGCAGHPFVKTPNIDRIAREGVLFRNFFITTPLCSPSRASFLTGQYVHTHGIRDNTNRGPASHKLQTFPKLLHEAGYETAYVGKWHMGPDDSPRPGFDRWVSFRAQGVYVDPPLNVDGKQVKAKGYMTDLLTDYAVRFVRQKRTRPFALYLAHKAVHGPFTPAPRHKALYEDATFTPPVSVVEAARSRESKPALREATKGTNAVKLTGGKAAAKAFPVMLRQLRCLAAIDEGVGELFGALAATGQLDNTVIVFTSDNGYFWREHALGDKRWAYEPSLRAPLLVRYPRLAKAGGRPEQLALNIDLAPTFLELAGVKAPSGVQGRSLVPLLAGGKAGWRRSFLAEYFRDGKFVCPPWQAVRTERWKYIHYPEKADADELYDLEADPQEMKNLAGDPKAEGRLKEMKQELARLLKDTAAGR
jgi:N-acetylglucosamine-6-sulfatase